MDQYLPTVRLTQSDIGICLCTCLQVICEKVRHLNQDSEQKIRPMYAESPRGGTRGSQRTVTLLPERLEAAQRAMESRPGEIPRPPGRDLPCHQGRPGVRPALSPGSCLCLPGATFLSSTACPCAPQAREREESLATSEVPPDPARLGVGEGGVI